MNLKIAILLLATFCFKFGHGQESNLKKNHDFDFLLFAQVWPISGCIEWEERSDKNTCALPNRQNWTVHGIWPTKDFTIGPLFCNRSASFDFNEIQGILDQLKLHWTNVRANTELENFWEHEWTKHGTCAMQLKVFNTELKYFSQGLALNEKFPLAQYLAQANIKPGKIYETKDVFEAVKKGIGGKNPALECQHMPEDFVKPVLTQIGICLDKNLSVIDCDKTHGGIYGKCPPFDFIEFPATEDRTRSGKAGMVWGLIIGFGMIMAFFIYTLKNYWTDRARTAGYEAI